jgi:hypothetical protein
MIPERARIPLVPSLVATTLVVGFAGSDPALAATAVATIMPEARLLAPHRAIYDVTLDKAGSSGITDIKGRLVFEFTGNVCEGFTQNMRFVMRIAGREGEQTFSDSRSSTWEEATGNRFRFSINNYENDQQSERTIGTAQRNLEKGTIEISLEEPKGTREGVPAGTLFPVQHTVHLLAAAKRGERLFAADLYDGSERGQKVFFTTSAIGRQDKDDASEALEAIKNIERLAGVPSWPVTISYYDQGSASAEGLPLHEMSFRFYENGVVRKLSIDYGTVSVKGVLSQLDFYEPTPCAQ